jgi:hypothetical protein
MPLPNAILFKASWKKSSEMSLDSCIDGIFFLCPGDLIAVFNFSANYREPTLLALVVKGGDFISYGSIYTFFISFESIKTFLTFI